MAVLEDQFKSLDLASEPKRQLSQEGLLQVNKEGFFELKEGQFIATKEALKSLNRLIEINKVVPNADSNQDFDGEIKTLIEKVAPFIKGLSAGDLSNVCSKEAKSILEIVSLMIANLTVNDFIKTEIDLSLIQKMQTIYLSILESLRNNELKSESFLLTRTSLISPLLITISFSFKLKASTSPTLIKILAILFTYLINNKSLFDPVAKLFAINSSTNIEMFQVFNKLWEKTLEVPQEVQLDIKQSPGPITIINRIDMVNNFVLSPNLVNHIIPYTPGQYLYQLSQCSLRASSILMNIKSGVEVKRKATELLGLVTTDLNCEVLLILIETLDVSDILVKLFENDEYKERLGYVFSKLSLYSSFKRQNVLLEKLSSKVLKTDIMFHLESSSIERYKVLFELLDHNNKIDFHTDFPLAFSIERSLYLIDWDFELQKDHLILSELGSTMDLPAIFIYSCSILSSALLKFTNHTKTLPSFLERTLELTRFPPLPKSDFSANKSFFLSNTQLNFKNSRLVTNALAHCLSILHKIIIGYVDIKDWIHPIRNVDDTSDDLSYQASDKFLLLNYSASFAVLNTVNELSQKSTGYNNDIYSPIFYDLSSTSHVLKLQIFQLYEDLFELYDSFGFFKLIKFIMKISMTDLELQKVSIKILNHLIFHSNNGLKESISENELLLKLLRQYVIFWNDGSTAYKQFEDFLGLQPSTTELVTFDTNTHLRTLGINAEYRPASLSPSTSSSESSVNNYSYSNTANNLNNSVHSISTPNTSHNYSLNSVKMMQHHNENSSGYFNSNANFLGNNQLASTGANTAASAGGFNYSNYRNSNISGVQQFIPEQQHYNGSSNNRSQSIHVDRFGK